MARFSSARPYAVVVEDVVYATPLPDLELGATIYRPAVVADDAAARVPGPGLVDIHGGAWRYFDRSVDAHFDRALAEAGAVVMAIDFRQAPQHSWPAAAIDVNAALRWLRAHADQLAVHPAQIGTIGGSSGGHLALTAALRPDDPALTPTGADPTDGGADVAWTIALWPVAAPDWRYRYLQEVMADPAFEPSEPLFDPPRLARAQERCFGDEAAMRQASVLRMLDEHDHRALPPAWVAHPEHDANVTREMANTLLAAYRAAGGDMELVVFDGVGHSFANFPGPQTDACIEQMIQFLDHHVG